ncbi:uncharacterized protein [Aristolochia californica]|uniref:uncharacterized protein n=1 Tax=Aristolochia californica TaxID=171875 RepID=UPI0035D948A1
MTASLGISVSFPAHLPSQEFSSLRLITSARQIHLPFERFSLSITASDGFPCTTIRMGGGPRTYPGGVSKWQWKRMQAKKAKQLLKARLCRERQIYEMRKRAELRAAVSELEKPWKVVERAPTLFSIKADEQLKALADRFQRPGGYDMWSERDGPQLFHNQDELPSARFFPKGAVHSVKPYGVIHSAGRSNDSEMLDVGEDLPKTKNGTMRSRRSSGRGHRGKVNASGDGKIIDLYPTSNDMASEGAGDLTIWESGEETWTNPDADGIRRNGASEGDTARRQGRLSLRRSNQESVTRNNSNWQSPSEVHVNGVSRDGRDRKGYNITGKLRVNSAVHVNGVSGDGRDRKEYYNTGKLRVTGNARRHKSTYSLRSGSEHSNNSEKVRSRGALE